MGSRLRENPRRLLECWCEVVGPRGKDNAPWIIQKFPNSYTQEEILKSVPQFAFPCSFESTNVQHFSFVLTSLDSKWTYGFCRHAPGAETALVLLSHLPWHETFYKLLNTLSEMMSAGRTSDMTSCLQNIYKFKVPLPGTEITVPYGDNKFFVAQCPNHLKLPTIPENRNLSEYYNAVDANNMMIIFASMLYERRIIMVSKRLSRLSACVQAANSVIYPMQWQHIFIPVLPQHLIDYLLAPMPFLIGVNTSLMSKVQMDDIGEAVILDADNNTVKTPFNDVETLPDEVVSNLKRNLKSPSNMLGDCVARAFLRALVQLIGNYKEALQFREEDSKITFNREKFVAIRPPHFQPFVEKMLELQIFQQFIEERLDRLNSGKQTSDEFELEVSVHCEKSSSKVKQQYKQFVTNVRKEGGAIMKTVKSKTNPAVKSAVKSVAKGGKQVKEKSRQTYKDLRGKIKDFQQPRAEDGSLSPTWMNGDSPQKPRSAPSSPVLGVKRRPQTVGGNAPHFSAKATYKRASQINIREETSVHPGTHKYELIERGSGLMSPGSTDSLSTPSPQSIDLMGEMEEVIRSRLGQDEEDEGPRNSSTGSSSSKSNSIPSSVSNSPAVGHSSTLTVQHSAKDHSTPLTASKKQLSASLTSLPLIDLSLDIELPPPIMASFGYRFPVSFDDDNVGGGDEDEGVDSSTSYFRSPKLLHDDRDFTTTANQVDGAASSVLDTNRRGHSQLSPRSPSRPSKDVSSVSADGQDLIFLESPQDEIFDPLFSKDIPQRPIQSVRPSQPPPPVPGVARSTSSLPGVAVQGEGGVGVGSVSMSHLPAHPSLARSSAINTTGLPNATPKRPSEYRPLASYQGLGPEYRPFSSLQTSMGTPVGCQNPMYNQHKPPSANSLPSSTRGGSAAAAFASSMLSGSSDNQTTTAAASRPGQYVQFEPPLAQTNKAAVTSSQPQRPPRLSQRDLLGDFSKDFQKLSVNSQSKAVTLGNNNNTVVNNNKVTDSRGESKNDANGPSESKWATFD
ncbi:DENN domain-containing protein 1B-like isoform X7 [Penaeus japonicus]|uniref:DENN domain-containing protein 1B-like isoform X7 n=1 Tax=Penaeus japonicus TaxID=27405 RepID=UPI001C7178AA|nr:DENN domain-containing protein 1B-like isoform X7 [Penaeus japonicus]